MILGGPSASPTVRRDWESLDVEHQNVFAAYQNWRDRRAITRRANGRQRSLFAVMLCDCPALCSNCPGI